MNFNFQLSESQINRLFPFYLTINEKLCIDNCGDSSSKLFKIHKNDYLNNHFLVLRPIFDLSSFEDIKNFTNQLIILEHKIIKIKFRGQFEFLPQSNTLLFIGSPWLVSMQDVLNNNLKIKDFAHHDPLIDLLHLLQTQEISNNDLKKLVNTINDQKQTLNLKNKEIHDIALFPMQNPDPLIRINFEGEILKNNPAAALLDFFEYENKQWRIDLFLKHIATDIQKTGERLVIEAISNNLTYSLACIPMPNEGYINIYGRNITERKLIEEKLEKQRKFYEDILNNMPADIAVFNSKHEYLFVNPKAIKNKEVRNWIIGKTDEDYCKEKNKPISIAKTRSELFSNVISNKTAMEWEEKSITTKGEEEFILRRLFPVIDENDEVKLVIGYGIDITERKKSEEALKINEEKYRSIIANMNLGLMELDKKGIIEFVNQRIQKMTGLNESNLIGKKPDSFLNSQSSDKPTSTINDSYEIETFVNGKQAWWLISSAPQYEANGKIKGSVIICLDISKQKKLEKELIQSREEAEKLAKTKETFLANMSHEIRTPMNAIMGIGNQLAKTTLTEKQQFFVKTINNASENLLYIINDILDLSKIEAGKLSIENIEFDLKKTVQQTIQMHLYKAEEKGLELNVAYFDDSVFEVLIGDPYRLNQILLNLISNAIKFTEKGRVQLKIEVLENTDNNQKIKFSVIDSGIGIDTNFIHMLFDKFSQEYESISRKYGGTGLGMSICKELINLMGGDIHVESEKNIGTTVSFILPFKKGQIAALLNETPSQEPNLIAGSLIIVADDNEMNRLVARTILENYNAKVIEVANGQEALSAAKNDNPTLILMDVQMPVLNGYEATKAIRNLGINIPVIALTANVVKGEKEKCLLAGMNDFITKPFKEEEFISCIAKNIKTITNANTSNTTQPTESLYNLTTLKEISKGNLAFIEKMIHLFLDIAPKTVSEIKEAFAKSNIELVNKLAHKLKPSIDNLSIISLKKLIRQIEVFDASQQSINTLQQMIEQLEEIMIQVVTRLKNEIRDIK